MSSSICLDGPFFSDKTTRKAGGSTDEGRAVTEEGLVGTSGVTGRSGKAGNAARETGTASASLFLLLST